MLRLYFGNSRERFDLLKSPRMIKIESGYLCSISVICLASCCIAALTHASGGMYTFTRMKEENSRGGIERFAVYEECL